MLVDRDKKQLLICSLVNIRVDSDSQMGHHGKWTRVAFKNENGKESLSELRDLRSEQGV